MPSFTPKRCLPPDPAFFTQLAGDSTEQVAKRLLDFIPPIEAGSVIHDNACGAEAMTDAIMATSPNALDSTVIATDIVPQMIERVNQKAREKGWAKVKAEVMSSEALTFEDGRFTHSFTNMGIMVMEKDVEAAREVFRTLRKGGVAVMSIWDKPLPVQVVTAAHNRFSPDATELPLFIERGGFDDEDLQRVMEDAGFDGRSIVIERTYAVLEVADLKWWANAVWSFVGAPVGGWTLEDERQWDETVKFMVEWLEGYEGLSEGEGRSVTFEMPAHVAIVRK
ncbi:S-adenosyl-L-methionine-dependent methyltransferase [Lophiostoma macrostomum CBS 122681]|uniref:S-adenosyl-L-methionine-dependent methyltransferase n=1 Tax=Lophiostoma macrostomum CBS 122681 TaxID=1314788 RepID=A0A6A6T4M5_9PLEO|nr:S-adenosyl-L-methionine-dependent methyltransferase [Lophiostoma macrostomum CBS 122681]